MSQIECKPVRMYLQVFFRRRIQDEVCRLLLTARALTLGAWMGVINGKEPPKGVQLKVESFGKIGGGLGFRRWV